MNRERGRWGQLSDDTWRVLVEFVTNYITGTTSSARAILKRLTRSLSLSLSSCDESSFRKVVSLGEKANEPAEEAIGKIAASFSCRAR